MGQGPQKYEIRASYDERLIAVYAAFDSHIADVAIQQQKLLPPFLLDRMTWIKPSFLWLMYRSEWGTRAGMGRVLQVWIDRTAWEGALRKAVLTTPERHVYADSNKWRKQLAAYGVRIRLALRRGGSRRHRNKIGLHLRPISGTARRRAVYALRRALLRRPQQEGTHAKRNHTESKAEPHRNRSPLGPHASPSVARSVGYRTGCTVPGMYRTGVNSANPRSLGSPC